ncbi:MAG: BON domain-containing protein [Armatimonadetes bacterium]|nr:BON domain-containing protein [Armatimonadota bacterium]PIU63989.1 MAG: hypothetical protein COS85_14300 [Armatimonadetes bacterium CG07_land_8_20_14_0_80_59_28]PIX44667.1 MAG: hypothetical protein COZ56_04055 [Armatimonadetes bacterium CG_4_8_14_3_um_filter_58_9]
MRLSVASLPFTNAPVQGLSSERNNGVVGIRVTRLSALVLTAIALTTSVIQASPERAKLEVPVGKVVQLPAPGYVRYAVTDGGTEVINISKVGDSLLSVRGLRPGTTAMVLFFREGVQIEYDVVVKGSKSEIPTPTGATGLLTGGTQQSANGAADAPMGYSSPGAPAAGGKDDRGASIQRAIGLSTVNVRVEGDTVTLDGTVTSDLERARAERIASSYSTTPVRNRLRVATLEPQPLEVDLFSPGRSPGRFTVGSSPNIQLELGLSRRISVENDLLKVLVSDETVVEPVVVSAREVVIIGRKSGRASLFVWEARSKNDVIGSATEYLVEVVSLEPPTVSAGGGPTLTGPPTGGTPQRQDPLLVQQQIEDALVDYPTVQVRVVESQSGGLAAILRGEVDTPEQAAHISQVVTLFVPQVISGIKATQTEPEIAQLSEEDLSRTKVARKVFKNDSLEVLSFGEGKIVLRGTVASREEGAVVERFARALTDEPQNVLNFLKVDNGKPERQIVQQVISEVKVVEISKTAKRNLGINWGETTSSTGATTGTTGAGVSVVTIEDGQLSFLDEVGGGGFSRVNPIGGILKALITEGKARVLSNPNITTIEGIPASIVVGGTIPIPAVSTSGGGAGTSTASVQFRQFGIILTVLPEATTNGQIVMQLRVEVSSPDFSNAVNISGSVIPGFKLRQANSSLMVDDGDTLVIGGLLSEEVSKNVNKVPLLSSIPILGELFKSKEYQRGETELVIFLRPRIKNIETDLEGLDMSREYQGKEPLETPDDIGGATSNISGGGGGTGDTGGTGGGR